jgi:peptidoglycan/LPS O-acetylase OafA/YrhL
MWRTGFDAHLWTMSVEYYGSVFLFFTILALVHLRPGVRLACLAVGIWLNWVSTEAGKSLDTSAPLMFLLGMFVLQFSFVDWTFLKERFNMAEYQSSVLRKVKTVFWYSVFFFALFLGSHHGIGSAPIESVPWTRPLWYARRPYLPAPRYADGSSSFSIIAAPLILASIMALPSLQTVFSSRPVRYLGKISFALYLVHGFLMKTVLYQMMKMVHYNIAFQYIACGIWIIITLAVSDVWTSTVDQWSITWGYNLERALMMSPPLPK